jgi:Protein of unknown function (DUF938)
LVDYLYAGFVLWPATISLWKRFDEISMSQQHAPATHRNRTAILEILRQVLPPTGTVLEVSSGTGEHAVFFAPQLAPRRWWPSDPNSLARDSITAWMAALPCDTLNPPIDLDASSPHWPVESVASDISAIVNINMIHIAPWAACLGLLAGAGRILPPSGVLYLYGPFKQNGMHTAPSNAAFDESLRFQDPAWGVRDLEEVVAIAASHQLALVNTYEMPANNLSVVFRRV